jgi:hypothetical protein
MPIKKFITTLFVLTCVITYVYSAVDIHTGETFSVNVDLSRPLAIVWPMEVSIVGDMGEKGLRIGPKIGRGWLDEAGGKAAYRFYVPEDGRYHIWMHCLWFDKCANAVFAKIDNLDRAIIGNDNIYKQWHWVRGFSVQLKRGAHDLELSNHSDHISLQNVLLTNSATAVPDNCGLIFSDIFYDGFDGCHIGNFASWQPVSGQWLVQMPPKQACFFENALTGKSQPSGLLTEDHSFIMYKADAWSDYSLNVAVKSLPSEDPEAATSICFGVEDPNHYYCLKWRPIEGTDNSEIQVSRKATGTQVLATFETPWQTGQWNKVRISLNEGNIAVKVNDEEPIETPVSYTVKGGIGFSLEGEITAYFDDIHVRTVLDNEGR